MARAIAPGLPHHITQRGNFGQDVFENDRERYLTWLAEYAQRYGTGFWAYCLMSNHVHFIAVPSHEDSLARTFNQTHMRYSQYTNRKHGRVGHLWQGRFYSCVLDETHLHAAVRYVERNPVRAGLVHRAEEYPWSSGHAHVLRADDPLLSDDSPLLETIGDWSAYLSDVDEAAWASEFRRSTRTGRPLGSEAFVPRIEAVLNRVLKVKPRGRPRKESTSPEK